MEEEVCLLDTRSAPRRQGNCQRSLGRTARPTSSPRMGPTSTDESPGEIAAAVPFFYHSTPGPYSFTWEQSGIYRRVDCSVLGDSDDSSNNALQDVPRCFNCGDSEHKVTTCPLPPNRDLIALSRQYHQFFLGNSPQWKRLHVAESWRQRRLNWLEEFEPGEIRGQQLRSALAENNEEWLKNISAWGYPPGWISKFDPRERVRDRIWSEDDGDRGSLDKNSLFEIHGEEGVVEHVSFHGASAHENGGNIMENKDVCRATQDDLFSIHNHLPEDSHPDIRWAAYPNSYFSSEFLFQYIKPKPSLPPSWDDTPFHDTMAYLNQFHVQYTRSLPSHSEDPQPPPPLESPPPLPPAFPPRFSSHGLPSSDSPIHSLDEVKSDMELSDDD